MCKVKIAEVVTICDPGTWRLSVVSLGENQVFPPPFFRSYPDFFYCPRIINIEANNLEKADPS